MSDARRPIRTVTGLKKLPAIMTIAVSVGILASCVPSAGATDKVAGTSPATSGAAPAAAAPQGPIASSASAKRSATQGGDHQAGLVAGEDSRLIEVRTAISRTPSGADGLQAPFRISSGGAYTLVLTARKAAYTLSDLVRLEPQTLTALPDKSFLIKENIVVAAGATLALGGGGPVTIRLQSDAQVFTSIVSLGGRLQLRGAASAPLTITSWNPSTASPDQDLSDGRAYIRADGGTVAISHLTLGNLGFWSGRTGGLALTGNNRPSTGTVGQGPHQARQDSRVARAARKAALAASKAEVAARKAASKNGVVLPSLPASTSASTATSTATSAATTTESATPVTGTAVSGAIADSTFVGNAFGLFISDAQGVHVTGTTVQGSIADGVVLHHFVSGTSIDHVTSQDNAGSGFVLSRGVQATVLNSDTALRNGKDGFEISGLPLASGPSAAGQSSTPYGNNELLSSSATDNGRAGVQIVSGVAETVQATRISGNAEGIVVTAGATGAIVSGNTVSGSRTNGVIIRDGSHAVVTGNSVNGGGNGIVVRNAKADLRNNVVTAATLHGLAFVGAVDGSTATGNTLAGKGSSAVYLSSADHRGRVITTDNNTAGWKVVHGGRSWLNSVLQPMTITLAVLLAVIVFGSFGTRRRGSRLAAEQHPYATTRSLYIEEPSRPSYVDLTDPQPGTRHDSELAGAGSQSAAQS